jgi:hypothetical protein
MPLSNRRKNDRKSTNGHGARVKLRWMDLDVEGGTSDLVEGFKSFAAALGRGAPAAAPARTLAASNPVTTAYAETAESRIVPDRSPAEAGETETVEQPPSEVISGSETERPKRRVAPRAPKFLSDLDLTKAPVQLADFVQEKSPDGDMDRYAVIAAWYKQQLNIEEITVDHVFTAYRALGWQAQLPDNPSQTFRNLKHKHWFDSGSQRGAYKINWNGENAVNKMGAVSS